ncbi:uncharacterized protein LOC128293826 [Gossypium arboreum]|uniref:uncharacterized protein LOC128293826 n=1 Tax=Gossypium arboreum TaxID=29729 RepID=UPI0022F15194|nr:uncharacterized protein LOC128293826 [Gossypium arboreum]
MGEKDEKQDVRVSNAPSRSRPQKNPKRRTNNRGTPRDSAVRSKGRAPARTYVIRAHKEASSLDVIMGTFSLHDISVVALIDLGSTHLYACPTSCYCHLMNLTLSLVCIWLSTYDVIVNCGKKFIELKCENGNIESGEPDSLPVVISSLTTKKYMRKGYEAYLAFVLNTQVIEVKIESVLVVCEFSDMFPEELPGLPLAREVEFGIELVPGTTLISISPYRMAQLELKELKA